MALTPDIRGDARLLAQVRWNEKLELDKGMTVAISPVEFLRGKRVLVTIGDNDVLRQAIVSAISPNKNFCYLDGPGPTDEVIGWVKCADVHVHDVWDNASRIPQSQ